MVLGVGYAMTTFFTPATSDDISESTKTELINQFAQAQPLRLTPVPADEVEAALDSMHLSTQEREALKATLTYRAEDPHTTVNSLHWLELWDFADQDGDVVTVTSEGYEASHALVKAPTRIVIPVGSSRSVTIRGTQDGGGGITLGVHSGAAGVSLPVLAPGQALTIPVTF